MPAMGGSLWSNEVGNDELTKVRKAELVIGLRSALYNRVWSYLSSALIVRSRLNSSAHSAHSSANG